MSYKIYHNPRCSKSRQALSILQEKPLDYEIIEYLKNVPTANELKALLLALNMNAEDILRKGESVYKENYKGKKLSEEEWIEAMVANPKLIERPIITDGKRAIIGRPPEKVLELI